MTLQDYRKLAGLSRAKAAAALGVTSVTVYRWETGRVTPSVDAIRRIQVWSKGAVTANDLLSGSLV